MKNSTKYTKKQILESIKHWKKVLEKMDESATIHDAQVKDSMKLVLEMPGSDGVDIKLDGDWESVRFAVDMLTDALAHMKKKDPTQYADVALHVER